MKRKGRSNEGGVINEVKRKDGRNEMNDLTANGRKELKRKEGSN